MCPPPDAVFHYCNASFTVVAGTLKVTFVLCTCKCTTFAANMHVVRTSTDLSLAFGPLQWDRAVFESEFPT